jgi:hypothetical protein
MFKDLKASKEDRVMRKAFILVLLILSVVLTACPSNPPRDFTLPLNPTSLTVQQGSSGQTTLTVTSQNGFTGTVNLSLVDGSGNPVPGITLAPTSVSVTGSSYVSQNLTVNVGSNVAPNTYILQLRATSGSLTKAANLSLTVTASGGGGGGGGAGTAWTLRSSGGRDLSGVTYGNGLFVAVGGSGTILTSPDGAIWTARNSGTSNFLYGVTYGNGLFVAVGITTVGTGDEGFILTSPDGVTWTQRTPPTSDWLIGVTYANGTFVAVGGVGGAYSSSTILTSSDGVNWTQQTSPVSNLLAGVTYGNGLFVAVGGSGTILTSPDGMTWTQQTSPASEILYDVAYGNGTFVAVGYRGTIVTSP